MTRSDSKLSAVEAAAERVAEAEGELALLRARWAEAQGELARAVEAEQAASLAVARTGGDEDHAAFDAAMARRAKAGRIVDNLRAALVPQAAAALAAAQTDLAEARRTEIADAAEAACAAAAAKLAADYPKILDRLAALKVLVEEADRQARAANADLPQGRRAVAEVEERVRDQPGVAERVIGDEVIEAWVWADRPDTPVPLDQVGQIDEVGQVRPDGRRAHYWRSKPSPLASGNVPPREVVWRSLRRIVIEAEQFRRRGPRIRELAVPPALDEALRWSPGRRTEYRAVEDGGRDAPDGPA